MPNLFDDWTSDEFWSWFGKGKYHANEHDKDEGKKRYLKLKFLTPRWSFVNYSA